MITCVRIAVFVASFHFALEHVGAGGTPWATPDQEALDELQDADILKAVVTSMQEWQKRQNSHRRKRGDSSVCYPEVGCFQDSGPFGYLDMLPSPPEEVSTRFFLYSGRARANSPAMDVPFSNLTAVWPWASKAFNLSAPTKVIVHGFGGSCNNVWVYEMRSALMTVEECNVICVDWEAGALIPNYVRAAANTRLVGKQLSMLLRGLNAHLGLPFHSVHVIGFSLGAHVAGFAGAELRNLSRITGLDPAAPLFESQDPRARLDSTDAMFVDVIHSNGENLILGGLGSWQPMGDVDFYPNGGRMQKGCTNLFLGAVTDILWSASDVEGRSLCNHRRAYKFFTDSVSPRCHFPSFPCESYDKFLEGNCFPCNGDRRCGNMGYYADRSNGRGTLYLITRDEEPFCAHQYHVRVESSPSPVPVTSYGKIQLTLIGNLDINETFTLTQKDDEELKVGSPLARIAVPHPVLQEPKSVQITYTAYSGWISSGLASWSVDKVTLTDSFGKSMSICKKGLVLDSGIPVTLPLYPGECNPPKENILEEKDSWTTPPSSAEGESEIEEQNPSKLSLNTATLNGTDNSTKYSPTPVVLIGDELIDKVSASKGPQNTNDKHDGLTDVDASAPVTPHALGSLPWQPVDYLESSNANSLDGTHNKRENSRAFNTHVTEVLFQLNNSAADTSKSEPSKHNNSSSVTTSERPEIKEPVLVPSSTSHLSSWPREANVSAMSDSHPHGKPEITEPVLNPKTTWTTPNPKTVEPREISNTFSGNYREQKNKWMPALNLNPPPISNGQTWQHWIPETTALNNASTTTERQLSEDKSHEAPESSNGSTASATTKNSKEPHSLPVTVQLFPERLAAILAQAERYARLTFSFPMAAISKLGYYTSRSSDPVEDDQIASASSNRLYSINTHFLSASSEDPNRGYPSPQTQRRPKHFATTRPTAGNANTKPTNQNTFLTFENPRPSNGKASPVTTETSVSQPRVDVVDNTRQLKDATRNVLIFIPYNYAYVSDDDDGGPVENVEMPRYIPLLRHVRTDRKSKYETRQRSDNDNQNSPEGRVKVKHFSSDRGGHFSIFHQYQILPER